MFELNLVWFRLEKLIIDDKLDHFLCKMHIHCFHLVLICHCKLTQLYYDLIMLTYNDIRGQNKTK